MQVIGGKARPDALLAPGVDFIFEHAIQQDAGERVIDTGIDFVPPVSTRLNGRKYIGENTVKDLAKLIGYVPGDAAQQVQADFDAYKAHVAEVFAKLEGVAGDIAQLREAVERAPNTISLTPPPDREAQIAEADRRAAAEAASIEESEAAQRVAEAEEAEKNG